MWNECSDDTGAFPKIKNMEKNYIDGASGTQLATNINFFSAWMLCQSKKVLDGNKKLCWSPESMSKNIGTFCVMLERFPLL